MKTKLLHLVLMIRSFFGFLILFAILVSTTTEVFPQSNWIKYSGNPVMNLGPPGAWDESAVGMPCIIFDDTTYHMWYGGNDAVSGVYGRIGYAWSTDGITWVKDTLNNPVLNVGPVGSWDEYRLMVPQVVFDGSIFHMWYFGTDASTDRVGHATSPDRVTWTKDTLNPVINVGPVGSWDWSSVISGPVLFDGTTFHMWYGGSDETAWRVGYATSLDGTNWTKDTINNPVLDVGIWDYPRVHSSSVFFDGTTYHMWYSGGGYLFWQIGYAWSTDRVNWTKDTINNPVLKVGPPGGWEDDYVGLCSVLFDSATFTYKMWYTGGDGETTPYSGRIGYAIDTTTSIQQLGTNIPDKFSLQQNYPNPFNPSTSIRFDLHKTSHAKLIVYNILGREVSTLVNEKLNAGSYEVNWNGSGYPSGVYFYKLITEEYVNVKKMLLVK